MKIEFKPLSPLGEKIHLDIFLESAGLTLRIVERDLRHEMYKHARRYYATINELEIKRGCALHGASGEGGSPLQAVHNLVRNLKGELLVNKATGGRKRLEFGPYEMLMPKDVSEIEALGQ